MTVRLPLSVLLLTGATMMSGSATIFAAEDNDPKASEFFEAKIRPVLIKSCYECHSAGATKVKGGLQLDSRAGLRKGGDNGPALVPGKPEESLLIKGLRHERLKMPPKEKLADSVIADFIHWVQIGAPDPRMLPTKTAYKAMTLDEAKSFWSFQPPRQPAEPKVKDTNWPQSNIDRFILARLEAKGLKPVADAEPRVLIRRLNFDLLGLPPTPEEVAAFEQSAIRNPQSAIEQLVDRLLASPHFGERWGRHWLDLARYAESNGSMNNVPFPNAWRYRNYVIQSLNHDKPYDRFIQEQIAGDLLPAETPAQRDEQLIATGFLALTPKPPAEQNPNYSMDLVADQIDVTSRTVLGLSVMCARCHDHKFDPIPTRDYYALAGIFSSSYMLHAGSQMADRKPDKWHHILSDQSYAMGVRENKPVDSTICIGGSSLQRGAQVPRGFLQVVRTDAPVAINRSQSGRLELAQWLTRSDNPLPARVAVNRVWLHLFGRGLVPTTDNFGSLGQPPSHAELLDHLALRFIAEGWSIKKIIRTIVLSRAYQLSSRHDAGNYQADPDNALLWRMNRRRLDAEALRDGLLAASGQLQRQPPEGSLSPMIIKDGKPKAVVPAETNYRSVYLGIERGTPLPEALSLFDGASPNLVVSQRSVTTVPGQTVYLLNSPFARSQARHLAERILDLPNVEEAGRVNQAYHLALARPASNAEQERALTFIRQWTESSSAADKTGQLTAWAAFCQALLASGEFLYLQ